MEYLFFLKNSLKKLQEKIDELQYKNSIALAGGGEDRIEKQHKSGKLTARERINILVDDNSFMEIDRLRIHRCRNFNMDKNHVLGDGVITGFGSLKGRKIAIFAQDFTIFGGSLSEIVAQKICKLYKIALKSGIPVIGLNDSGGARIQEGVLSLAGYADIFCLNTMASGVIPQISVIMGPSAGGAVYSPALTDFIIMIKKSYMFITGPEVIKTVTNENVSKEDLGGSITHNTKSGVAHFSSENELEGLNLVKELFEYIPDNNSLSPIDIKYINDSSVNTKLEEINSIIPIDLDKSYNILNVIKNIVDNNKFLEVHKDFAKNIITSFARINGKVIAIVANQPQYLAGAIDINASDKAARFVRFCDCFNIPIVTLVDVPGFLPGVKQEHNGIIRHGAKLLYAYSEATVPKITIILRKAYGGAYCVMGSKHLRTDFNFALPMAEIAVIGAKGAYNIMSYNKNIDEKVFISDYANIMQNPYRAAEFGYIDEIILPQDIRIKIIQSLSLLNGKIDICPNRKHGNIPL